MLRIMPRPFPHMSKYFCPCIERRTDLAMGRVLTGLVYWRNYWLKPLCVARALYSSRLTHRG